MTASRPEGRARCCASGLALAAALLVATGCRTPGAVPETPALAPPTRIAPIPPDDTDLAAADLAVAALAADATAAAAGLARLADFDGARVAAGGSASGLGPVARDLLDATLGDPRADRAATRALLAEGDLDPALETRLERQQADDPLLLARDRVRDARWSAFAQFFNTVAEPIGQSLLSLTLAPYRLGQSLLRYSIGLYVREPLPLQQRQALAQWQRFLELHPNAPEASELREKVDRARVALARTLANRELAAGDAALDTDRPDVALVHADRALRLLPEDSEAEALQAEAATRAQALWRARAQSSEASPEIRAAVLTPEERALAFQLLDPRADLSRAVTAARAAEPSQRLSDTARYVDAIAAAEAGREDSAECALDSLARRDPADSALARHAVAWRDAPELWPQRAFRSERWRNRRQQALFVLAGPWFQGPPERGLPDPVEWLLDLPALPQVLLGAPLRLLQLPWTDPLPAERAAAIQARRYLERFPQGEHAADTSAWLRDFESDRGNAIGALRAAKLSPEVDADELRELEELAAEQALAVAEAEESRPLRLAMLRDLARQFPNTPAAQAAGRRFRDELEKATLHRVRLSRGFLLENPSVSGPHGLGLAAQLFDEDSINGELHPEGIALIGSGEIEIAYQAPGEDDEAPPEYRREKISEATLARVVSLLDEAALRNSLLDSDDPYLPDAQRDVFFERARLGLADLPDQRAESEARFAYRGMRERYGMVRSRESILPFDLVLQGSLWDFSLGAFPRWREPPKTPDAYLYR